MAPTARQLNNAYHEAGHALAAARYGLLGDIVSVDPTRDSSGFDGGETKIVTPRTREELQDRIEAYIVIAAAGVQAQYWAITNDRVPGSAFGHLFDASNPGDKNDRAFVNEYLRYLDESTSEDEADSRYYAARDDAFKLVTDTRALPVLEAIANALLERHELSREEVLAMVRAGGLHAPSSFGAETAS